jgi:hypothetical protein
MPPASSAPATDPPFRTQAKQLGRYIARWTEQPIGARFAAPISSLTDWRFDVTSLYRTFVNPGGARPAPFVATVRFDNSPGQVLFPIQVLDLLVVHDSTLAPHEHVETSVTKPRTLGSEFEQSSPHVTIVSRSRLVTITRSIRISPQARQSL